MVDYYQLLGVPRDADGEQIKKAYRKLALEFHPDRNQGSKDAEEKFKEVTKAYEVLREPEKRSMYDRHGEQGVRGGGGHGGGQGFDFNDAIDIFMRDFGGFGGGMEDLFGRGGAGRPTNSVAQRADGSHPAAAYLTRSRPWSDTEAQGLSTR